MGTLGIIAGGGDAPRRLLDLLDSSGKAYALACLAGQADADLPGQRPHLWVNFGEAQKLFDFWMPAGVDQAVMLGRVQRPSLSEIMPDALAIKHLARIGMNFIGDNNLMTAVAKAFEAEGIKIIGVQDITREWLTPEGVLTQTQPDEQAWSDITRGIEVARLLGMADVGQGVVIQQGATLALEAVDGTDAMLARVKPLLRPGASGVLVKCCKPQQDKRLDLPTVGLNTVRAVQAAGLRGMAVEAGASLMLDRAALIAEADQAGLFVVGIKPPAAS